MYKSFIILYFALKNCIIRIMQFFYYIFVTKYFRQRKKE